MRIEKIDSSGSFQRNRVVLWQALLTAALCSIALGTGRGSLIGISVGAAVLCAGFVLQNLAVHYVLSRARRPYLAVLLFALKLGLLLALAFLGFEVVLSAPISFATGVTTLLLAILFEAWYSARWSRALRP